MLTLEITITGKTCFTVYEVKKAYQYKKFNLYLDFLHVQITVDFKMTYRQIFCNDKQNNYKPHNEKNCKYDKDKISKYIVNGFGYQLDSLRRQQGISQASSRCEHDFENVGLGGCVRMQEDQGEEMIVLEN